MTKAAQKGFTLIEILIVIAILAVIVVAILMALSPLEQINRSRDSAILQTATELYEATTRMMANSQPTPWETPLSGVVMASAEGESVIVKIVAVSELKASFSSTNHSNLQRIFLTASEGYENRALCFLPLSEAFRQHQLTQFTRTGEPVQNLCPDEGCYFCLNETSGISPTENRPLSLEDMTEEELCADFNPEYPYFAMTTNFSSTFSHFGCTNYAVDDLGCDTGRCPAGQRSLIKQYYNPLTNNNVRDWTNCTLHMQEAREYYCVNEPHARCDINQNGYWTGGDDFEWGCSQPRRPIRWSI